MEAQFDERERYSPAFIEVTANLCRQEIFQCTPVVALPYPHVRTLQIASAQIRMAR